VANAEAVPVRTVGMALFPRELRTERLRLRAATPETVDPLTLYRHCGRDAPGVDDLTRYLTWAPHETPKETYDFLADCETAFAEGEAATYVISPRGAPDELAGMTALRPDWEHDRAGMGLWLRPSHQGNGYAGERARALARVAFDRLDCNSLVVTVNVDNEPSLRAVRDYVDDLGGREEGRLRSFMRYEGGEVVDVVRFSVTRTEWAEATGAPPASELVVD
jgi:RimJ/RimL family protein N-acetyltransferase